MTNFDNFYSSELHEEHCEVHFTCGGFWTPEIMREFFADTRKTTLPLLQARKPIYAIGDLTKALPQDRATADVQAEELRNSIKFGLKRMAIVNAGSLMKMQYRRVVQEIELEFFDSKQAGLAWLRANR
jgi:hypothetical protein